MSRVLLIVCTYDGLETARDLERVLAAEDHNVEILYGPAAQAQLATEARADAQAVVLIWSHGAGGSAYIAHWRKQVEPARLIEIAVCDNFPTHPPRRWPVIDFANWKGRRGSAAWRALSERLKIIARAGELTKPGPVRAAMALGVASLAAVGGAAFVRVNEPPQPIVAVSSESPFAMGAAGFDGQGGPLRYAEPAGADDPDVVLGPLAPRMTPISTTAPRLARAHEVAAPVHARTAGLLGRIADMAEPLIDRVSGDDSEPQQAP